MILFMSEFYYGTIGKNKSFGLLSDKRIVVYKKRDSKSRGKSEFIPVDTLAEAEKLYKNLGDTIFFWNNGDWQEVSFIVQGKTPKNALGFSR
jgi:hypothetical protein